ncbi:unnamed protein product [Schistosoma mansoni]|uniref:Smp_206100 n=1 Tax=Schistosoma mansoni TaxID=6183 RepID=UPI00022C8733|nr:unnamed protein product [Schistosoma mansoni]|eukprot:XP_018644810.1 unnamed protein product [Schistosoma mansoni]
MITSIHLIRHTTVQSHMKQHHAISPTMESSFSVVPNATTDNASASLRFQEQK